MSEKRHSAAEHGAEQINHHELTHQHEQRIKNEQAQAREKYDTKNSIETARKQIEAIDHSSSINKAPEHHERPHHYITKDIKKGVYLHTLHNARAHLSKRERIFSSIVHSDVIEAVSEIGSKTIARPNAIIGGGISMVVGGIILYILARYYGYTLPLSTFIALYVIGFICIVALDAIKYLALRLKKR